MSNEYCTKVKDLELIYKIIAINSRKWNLKIMLGSVGKNTTKALKKHIFVVAYNYIETKLVKELICTRKTLNHCWNKRKVT